jgi:cohesin loading factor subunit SCC2
MEVTSHFWQNVFQRWAAPKNPDGADVKGIVDNLLVDLLTTLNVPEFPAASLLLQVVKHMFLYGIEISSYQVAVEMYIF